MYDDTEKMCIATNSIKSVSSDIASVTSVILVSLICVALFTNFGTF